MIVILYLILVLIVLLILKNFIFGNKRETFQNKCSTCNEKFDHNLVSINKCINKHLKKINPDDPDELEYDWKEEDGCRVSHKILAQSSNCSGKNAIFGKDADVGKTYYTHYKTLLDLVTDTNNISNCTDITHESFLIHKYALCMSDNNKNAKQFARCNKIHDTSQPTTSTNSN